MELSDEYLSTLSKEELNMLLKSLVQEFHDFANQLAQGGIKDFAPPFQQYFDTNKNMLDFCADFFKIYSARVAQIDKDVLERVNRMFQVLVMKQQDIVVSFDIVQEVKDVSNMVLDAIQRIYQGFPSLAFEALEKAMTKNNCHLLNILPQTHYSGSMRLYRIREGSYSDCRDLYHVPFHQRARCGTYRYSIPGYPSLYLAGSLETALKECRVTDNRTYSASCYSIKKPVRFIDFGFKNKDLKFWEQYSFIVSYPLIVACSLKVKDSFKPFIAEYCIPQLLFQLIRLYTDMDGISYVSTRYDIPDYFSDSHRNFVMTIDDSLNEEGYSQKLSDKLKVTSPIVFGSIEDLTLKEKALYNQSFIDINCEKKNS